MLTSEVDLIQYLATEFHKVTRSGHKHALFLSLLIFKYLEDRQTGRMREIFHLLIRSLNVHNSLGWARPGNLGAQTSTWASHLGSKGPCT